MSKNRMVNTRFWSDGFIVDGCNALDRYLFLYLLTNEKTNIIGIYELSLKTAANETGIEKDDLQKMLMRLSPKIEYFDGWVYIRKFTDHQQINPNVEKGMIREVFNLPDSVIKSIISLGVDSKVLCKAFDSLSKAFKASESLSVTKPNLTKPIGIEKENPDNGKAKQIQEIYEHYLKAFDSKIKLSDQRKIRIKARLKDAGYNMIIQAIDNCLTIPFYMGENDRGWTADLDYIIRTYENVEKLANSNKKRGEVKIEEW